MEMLRLSSGLRRSPRLRRLTEEVKNEVRKDLFADIDLNLKTQNSKEIKFNTNRVTKGGR